jgi:phosphopantothenoylcysteine synthetase/decarboxylase
MREKLARPWVFPMNVLVTAGNTLVPIDRVRCITNVFTGRTGAAIALRAHQVGHAVTLLTSHPEAVADLRHGLPLPTDNWHLVPYRTFEDLQQKMAAAIVEGRPDGVVHCAAVSDYLAGGIYAPAPGTHFDAEAERWHGTDPVGPALVNRAAGKVKSDEPELWLRLVRAPKLIDQVRAAWGFRGLLVKFKLEVGIEEPRLLEIAEASRRHSGADLMVANTLEGAASWALLGPLAGTYQRINRAELASRLMDALEALQRERSHG